MKLARSCSEGTLTWACSSSEVREWATLTADLREDASEKICCTIAAFGAVLYVCFSLHTQG